MAGNDPDGPLLLAEQNPGTFVPIRDRPVPGFAYPPRTADWPVQMGGMQMPELVVDFITSLDGYASAEGWPGWWGLEGPEYLAWLGANPERDHLLLMGANTYRLMHGFTNEGEPGTDVLGGLSKVVFST